VESCVIHAMMLENIITFSTFWSRCNEVVWPCESIDVAFYFKYVQ